MVTLAEVVDAVHAVYDPAWAEPWDAVGLVCGEPAARVRRVLLAVDPVAAVVDEALAWQADLVLTHHPLYLRGTTTVAADTAKGRVIHSFVRHGSALLVAHTNADVARPGVSDALAAALGLRDLEPLAPMDAEPLDKLAVFVPTNAVDQVIDALAAAGAGALGDYSRCAWTSTGVGTFVPGEGSDPTLGQVGVRAEVEETRVEMVLSRSLQADVLRALAASHPYEEPAFDLLELAGIPTRRGLGRVGDLTVPLRLGDLVRAAGGALPGTAGGLRAAGDPDRLVRRLAVCGGSGGELAGAAARAGAQALLTADLRHHIASEAVADTGLALVDAPHWATEQPWLAQAAEVIHAAFGTTVETQVSTLVTDPWTLHSP